ncbi:protein phosphatase 2C domain-containing protein [Acuticoccus sp. MNP-M23]|uniref:PP2C family protein-serine/threonine phosphatase n=1 Tax=Acuticoccus sp. MNP-M23 TaxID=3072793 RepID=UPI002814AAB7|nr:protein phosphatase 2C domain-containing protein [Acuticoccus sp. MNP-M23]WMS44147.1 protein phosphatase 2C domain-containing protein [Acuticoccus sp. MNP-M23]
MKFRFHCATGTHEGRVRTRNEDALLSDPDHGIWVVADGMGGEAAGDHASATVIAAMTTIGRATSADDLLGRTQDRLTRAHRELVAYAHAQQARVVGAAVVALLAYEEYVACVWSGDSRLYRIRQNRLAQLSRDHNEVGDLLARNVISREEALAWKGRNAITRAVGVYDELEMEVLYGDLRAGDAFILCSDGLTLHVTDDEIRDYVIHNEPEAAVSALIEQALARGGEDNVSVIVVRADVDTNQTTVFHPARKVM